MKGYIKEEQNLIIIDGLKKENNEKVLLCIYEYTKFLSEFDEKAKKIAIKKIQKKPIEIINYIEGERKVVELEKKKEKQSICIYYKAKNKNIKTNFINVFSNILSENGTILYNNYCKRIIQIE